MSTTAIGFSLLIVAANLCVLADFAKFKMRQSKGRHLANDLFTRGTLKK